MMLQSVLAIMAMALALPDTQKDLEPTPSSQEDVVDLGQIDVTSQRLQQQVQSFIREATAAPPGRVLARWDRSICVGVSNLDPRYARLMIDRITTVAAGLGIHGEEPGCKPSIIIVAASDADALAQALVADDPRSFRPARNATTLGEAALERFQSTEAPVRWWHVSLPVVVGTGELAVTLDGEVIVGRSGPEPLQVAVRDASRLRANTRDDLARVIVVVDVNKVGRIGFRALSDYVAMVALAQIAPDADTTSYDTVLNLFSEGSDRSAGLSQWDIDYLTSLYSTRRDYAQPTQQARGITNSMAEQRAGRSD